MNPAPPARIYLFAAKQSPRVAVLRRKPSRQWHLVVWNTKTDFLEHGSWFQGTLYPERCDISWDGQWFVYNALGRRGDESWSGICRLPFLKTVFEWNNPGDYGGGGCWIDDDTLLLDPWPDGVQELNGKTIKLGNDDCKLVVPESFATRAGDARLGRDGWMQKGSVWETSSVKTLPPLRLTLTKSRRVFSMEGFKWLDQTVTDACWDVSGQLLIARAGCLERYRVTDSSGLVCAAHIDLETLSASQ